MTVDRSGSCLLMTLALAWLVAGNPTDAHSNTAGAMALSDAARAGEWERVRALVAGGLEGEDVNGAVSASHNPGYVNEGERSGRETPFIPSMCRRTWASR